MTLCLRGQTLCNDTTIVVTAIQRHICVRRKDMSEERCTADMQLGGIRENPEDVCTTIVIFRCVEVVTGDARNIDIRTVVDDHNILLAGRDRQHRITCQIEVNGVIIAATVALDLTVLSRLEFDVLLFQSLFTEIALNFCVDGFERGVHIDVVIIDTERTILHAGGIRDVLAPVCRPDIHINAVVIGMVSISTVVADFTANIRGYLVFSACLTNHVAGQIQITANGDLSDGVNSRGIVLDKEVVVVEDIVEVVRPTVLRVGFVRGEGYRSASSIGRNRIKTSAYHSQRGQDREQTLFQIFFAHVLLLFCLNAGIALPQPERLLRPTRPSLDTISGSAISRHCFVVAHRLPRGGLLFRRLPAEAGNLLNPRK